MTRRGLWISWRPKSRSKTLSQKGALHGDRIVVHVQRASDQSLRVEEGSLYAALHRMGQSRWIASEWALTRDQLAREGYRLCAAGRIPLLEAESNFKHLVKGVRAILRYA